MMRLEDERRIEKIESRIGRLEANIVGFEVKVSSLIHIAETLLNVSPDKWHDVRWLLEEIQRVRQSMDEIEERLKNITIKGDGNGA